MTKFYSSGRIGEVAGVQTKNIYFDQEFILIKESIVWTDVRIAIREESLCMQF